MKAQPSQYYAIYDPNTGQYYNAAGLHVLSGLDAVGNQLATQNFSNVTVKLEQNGRVYEHTFERAGYPTATGGNYGSQFSTIKDISSAINSLFFDLVSNRPLAEEALGLGTLKMQLLFEGVKGELGVVFDVTDGIIHGEPLDEALGSAGINFASSLIFGIEGAAVTAGFIAVYGATWPWLFAAVSAGLITALALEIATNTAIEIGTHGVYDDLGDFVFNEVGSGLSQLGEDINSGLQIAGKNLSQIFTWKDASNKAQVKGDDFTATIDPATGKLTFYTGIESTRQAFKDAPALEGLTNLVKQKLGDPYGLWTKVDLLNTADPTKKTTYTRIPKELETRTQLKTGTAVNLNTLTPVKQTDSAKYYTPTQIAPLKLKTNEYNQAKKDNLQSGINAARSNGTLTNLGKQQSIDDQARRFIKAANIDRPEESLDGNRLFYMVAETGHEVANDHGNYRNKTSFDLYTFDLTKSTQTVTHVPGDYSEVVYAQYAQYAQINQNVKTLWLNYQTQVSAALCQAA